MTLMIDGLDLKQSVRWEAARFAMEALRAGQADVKQNQRFTEWLGGATGWLSKSQNKNELARRCVILRLVGNANDSIETLLTAAEAMHDYILHGIQDIPEAVAIDLESDAA